MKSVLHEIDVLILKPKKEKLILELIPIVTGEEANYTPFLPNPKYFEIWFYHAFDFNYIIIGWKNIVINISNAADQQIVNNIFDQFKQNCANEIEAENKFMKLKQELEFNFFSECWSELETKIGQKVRCFLIEYGILRGVDVNNRKRIDCEEIGKKLKDEGIPYHN